MKTSWMVWAISVVAVVAGSWYYLSNYVMLAASPDGFVNQDQLGILIAQQLDDTPLVGEAIALRAASDATLGKYLVGYLGTTVYTTSKDTGSTSNCYDACALNWPPYLVSAKDQIKLGSDVTGKSGTTARTDGTLQLTYNDIPLYFFAKDLASGDIKGNGVGGVWSVVKP